ncbi:MAG TPA: adenylosuccinate synthase [Chitinophagales bacterium]|nr:adenylosuccinate synthase [Chitinophagales bacterium]
MPVDVLIGLQWGDEGKGKIVDYLAPDYTAVARFQGGPNAGHTLNIGGKKFVLHTVPSGIFRDGMQNLVGNGVVLDPVTFAKEIKAIAEVGVNIRESLHIARKVHLILPTHRILDAASEAAKGVSKIGSTLKGIGPTYMDKTGRNGLRVGDTEAKDFKQRYNALKDKHLRLLEQYDFQFDLAPLEDEWFAGVETLREQSIVDGEYFINERLAKHENILAEGAQGAMLDIEFGTYPYVTSSHTSAAAACTGLGIAPSQIRDVIGITKAYCTRVGSGPFPTELTGEDGEAMRKAGNEFGSTTGRPRRCGWIDIVALNYTVMLSGVTQLIVTKADVLNVFNKIKAGVSYRVEGKITDRVPYDLCNGLVEPIYETLDGWKDVDLSQQPDLTSLNDFVRSVETRTGVPVRLLSVGPERSQLIERGQRVSVV